MSATSNFLQSLDAMHKADREHYLKVRTIMRKTYLIAVINTVGMEYYGYEDDSFMDAIDMKVEMLMKRAGFATPNNQNLTASPNQFDPFAHITSPSNIAKLEADLATLQRQEQDKDGWGNKK